MKYYTFVISVFVLLASLGPVRAASEDNRYAYPGQLIAAGNKKLNFYCSGIGSPTVVFDAGWEDWSPAWTAIQPAVSGYTRTCVYDRAGSGFSDGGPAPRTSVVIARELHAALHGAGIPGPYLLGALVVERLASLGIGAAIELRARHGPALSSAAVPFRLTVRGREIGVLWTAPPSSEGNFAPDESQALEGLANRVALAAADLRAEGLAAENATLRRAFEEERRLV